jgi:hypothetical protein
MSKDDLASILPQELPTITAIYDYHKKVGDAEPHRGYLGPSILGHECDRFLWLTFRGAIREDKPGRVYRLLERGDREELEFIRELRAIGCTVHDKDEKGEQFTVEALGGHLQGHMDAIVVGLPEAPKTPHLGEFKTASEKNFAPIAKDGVKKAKPQHFAQMQLYMGLAGFKRALYLVVNKNTDELHGERIEFDRDFFGRLMARAKRLIDTAKGPEKIAKRPDDFRCKFCAGHSLCWGAKDGEPAVPIKGGQTCRTCVHATAETDREGAVWTCAKYNTALESTDVGASCPSHTLLPAFVNFAEPTDSDDDWIEFTNRDGTKWRQGKAPNAFTTQQLMTTRGPLERPSALASMPVVVDERLPDDAVAIVPADPFEQGRAVAESLPLIAAYPYADSEKVWDGPLGELAGQIEFHTLTKAEALPEPNRTQDDENVNAAEYRLPKIGDYLIVAYKKDGVGAIWRGKE